MKSHPAILMPADSVLAGLTTPSGAPHPPIALCAWHVRTTAPIAIEERLDALALAQAHFADLVAHFAGLSAALEVRYLCDPVSGRAGHLPTTEVYVLLRATLLSANRADLKRGTLILADALAEIIHTTMPWCAIAPLATRDELAYVLTPWRIRDVIEVHRGLLTAPHGPVAFAPYRGVLDANYLLAAMGRAPCRTMLALRAEPVELDGALRAALWSHAGDRLPWVERRLRSARETDHEILRGDAADSRQPLGPAGPGERRLREAIAERLAGISPHAYRFCAQMAGEGVLNPALGALLAGEVGAPGHLTARAFWDDSDDTQDARAQWLRPRPGRPTMRARGTVPAEMRTARQNLAYVLTQPLISSAHCPCRQWAEASCPLEELAGLGEVARVVALPHEPLEAARRANGYLTDTLERICKDVIIDLSART